MPADLLLEPAALNDTLISRPGSMLVDVSSAGNYHKHHLPSAIFFDFRHLLNGAPPAPGLLPDTQQLAQALADAGIGRDKTIIAYDDEGGSKASRLLWTLDILGFEHLHLVNGGLHAWVMEHGELESGANPAVTSGIEALAFNRDKIADKAFILENLGNPQVVIWDTRSAEEYAGTKPRAQRNGHIPGAVNLNWLDTIDKENGLRYLPRETLVRLLESRGITPDKTIVPHCHTHHRSAHSAVLLEYLQFPDVKAYPGSWSEWGNADDTPVEQ